MNNISKEKKEEMKYLEENSLNEKELKNLKKKDSTIMDIIIEIITWILA